MGAIVSRKLNAMGYLVGEKLKLRGVSAVILEDELAKSKLLITPGYFGPSWPQIHKTLEQSGLKPALVSLGRHPEVLIEDSAKVRTIVASLARKASASRTREVHLDGVGFVKVESKVKLDLKLMLLPALSVFGVAVAGLLWNSTISNSPKAEAQDKTETCILDSSAEAFESWLADSLRSEPALTAGAELQIDSSLGELMLVVENTIGSAAKVSGYVSCSDGRRLKINHRIDTSGNGTVLELGQ